ncbi:response regulator transcription factor [Sphaerisporangium krabiense]|uniref:DNA-binding NarL/FixJ family response regulator n=1 Tax=Sphaerisporangium krabiense TaxID=763782 RepID=A0A7W9DNV5_9ACTN|nr:response regulator transcription factor [Sphaerisporangium krabiense]MBB5625747.1 DNA-binding NarL/FixJ family response regulator [Sphaerisporangium krabiense]
MTIHVVIADDQASERQALRVTLDGWPDVKVIGEGGMAV